MNCRAPGRTATVTGAIVLATVIPGAWPAAPGGPAKAAAPLAMSADAAWCLQPPAEGVVPFRGLEAADANALGAGAMLYPAPSVVAALAAVAAHAAVVGGVRAQHAREHAAAADKVLEPYQAVLGSFRSQELEDRALAARTADGATSLPCTADRTASAWIIDSAPVFFMAQDQTALVLDNVLAVHPRGPPGTNAYRHVVRVVSAHLSPEAPATTWLADDGARLKAESIALFGQSLDIALRVAAGDPVAADAPFKSFHYYEGTSDKVERAQLVSETCERLLLRTLRATFLSVPTMRTDCAPDEHAPPTTARPGPG